MRFARETVLITGAGSGIGQAIAVAMAAEGARIAVTDRYKDRTQTVASLIIEAGGVAMPYTMDVADEEQVNGTISAIEADLGPISILVNNAGLSLGTDITRITPEQWDINFAVVLRGPYLCVRAVLPGMIERHRGVILNISSVNGMYGIGEEAYAAAKAGLINLTQNLAVRHGSQGIRCNAISPGTITSPIWQARLEAQPDAMDHLIPFYPLGRVGEVEDVAKAALFLCSNEASWITGVNLPVDGGLTAGSHHMSMALKDPDKPRA